MLNRSCCAVQTVGRLAILVPALWALAGADWPQWRGPTGDGQVTDGPLPLEWSADRNVAWKVPVAGAGHSSPIVAGDRVFLTSCREDTKQRLLLCFGRADGRLLWERVVLTAPLEPKHKLNSFASSTPATDGRRVWVTFQNGDRYEVACYDLDGDLVWRLSPGEFHSRHGFCSPPVLFRNLIILNGDQDAVAWLVALEKDTGKEVWRADRPNRTRSYCPPLIVQAAGKPQLILSGSKSIASYDPATGHQHWLIDGPTEQFVASPVFSDGLAFVTGGYPTHHLLAIRPDGAGNVTETHVVWHHKKQASYVPSPIAAAGCFFVVTDQGRLICLDAATGKIHYQERLGTHHSGSPIAANGHLYFPDDNGTTFVVKADRKFELVAKNSLGEPCFSSPAVSRGQIFLRTSAHLWCIGTDRASRRDEKP
jgi:outer membrane protein assembly factor BamB